MVWPHLFRAVGPLYPHCYANHLRVFLLTFISYILYYASRKAFHNVKMTIASYWIPLDLPSVSPDGDDFFLNTKQAILLWGTMDTVFLFSYALGLYINGVIGEWINLRLVMAIGMCSSALASFCFGTLTNLLHFYNKWFYFCLSVFGGLLECTGWPCVVAIMDCWFGITGQCFVFGLWSTCASMGNILGVYVASLLLQYGYEYTFLVTASMQLASGLIIFFTLWLLPQERGPRHTNDINGFDEDFHQLLLNYEYYGLGEHYGLNEGGGEGDYVLPQPTAFSEVSSMARALLHSLAYASSKLVNCSFFFWLPFYLNSSFEWGEDQVNQISGWYDFEGITCGAFHCFLSDVVEKRSIIVVCVLLAAGSLVGYHRIPQNRAISVLLMSVAGLFIGGPADVMGFAISSDEGYQTQMQGSREALAPFTGIVDRTVSMGTVVGQYLVSLIQDKLGWMWLFCFFMLVTGFTILLISLLLLRKVRDIVKKRTTPTFRE